MAQDDKRNLFQLISQFTLKYFCIMGHNRLKKFVLVNFPQKSLFNTIVQFQQNLGQNHTTLCPRMSHDSLSKKFEIWCDGVKLHQSNSEFTKKIPFLGKGNLGQIWAKIMQHCLVIHSLKIFLKFCGMMRHNIHREK